MYKLHVYLSTAQDEKGRLHPWSVFWKAEEPQQGKNVNHGNHSLVVRAPGLVWVRRSHESNSHCHLWCTVFTRRVRELVRPLTVLMSIYRHHVKFNSRPGSEEQRTRGAVDFVKERGEKLPFKVCFPWHNSFSCFLLKVLPNFPPRSLQELMSFKSVARKYQVKAVSETRANSHFTLGLWRGTKTWGWPVAFPSWEVLGKVLWSPPHMITAIHLNTHLTFKKFHYIYWLY